MQKECKKREGELKVVIDASIYPSINQSINQSIHQSHNTCLSVINWGREGDRPPAA
jgi:hypothetical protein